MASEIGVTQNTVNHYLEILEQTFIVYGVHSYSSKLANELKKSQKYFFYDSGISNSFIKNFSPLSLREDLGCIYESLVFRELKKKQASNVDLRFWRTKNGDEVDFVWIEDRVAHPIEVKTTTTNDRPPRGLLKFLKTYPKAKMCQIFNLTRSEIISVDNFVIHYRQFSDLVRGITKNDIMND
jgi:predicted AAA+ superfamily ATPase